VLDLIAHTTATTLNFAITSSLLESPRGALGPSASWYSPFRVRLDWRHQLSLANRGHLPVARLLQVGSKSGLPCEMTHTFSAISIAHGESVGYTSQK
jgi:hypothetical protein